MGGQGERFEAGALANALLSAGGAAEIGTAVTVRRPDGRFEQVFVNDAALAINGYDRDEIMAMPALALVVPEDVERVATAVATQKVVTRYETTIIRKDGARIPIQLVVASVPWADDEGGQAIVSYFFDLRSQKQAESALRQSEANLRRLIDSAPDGIVLFEGDHVLYANPSFIRLLGFNSFEELAASGVSDIVGLEDREIFEQRMAMIRERRSPPVREIRRTRSDGSKVVIEATAIPFEYEGRPAVLGFAHDVTERRQLGEQMARVDRLVALGTLAAGVAHEINNPTAVATTNLEALDRLLRSSELPESERDRALALVAEARGGTERVATIVRELRGFSRSDDDRKPVDLNAVLATAERMTESALRHRARVVRTENRVPMVWGNQGRLEQVFVNLLLNAAQAMPVIETTDNVVTLDMELDGESVVVEVRDNGVGISAKNLPRVFDPFFTTKPPGEGTGLGLAICQTIVTQLGGTISVESDIGKGSTFRVRLPVVDREAHSRPVPRRTPAKRARILIVDDEPTLVRTLVTLLGDEHDVVGATSGADALSLLLAPNDFDLVLCDLMMPYVTGMDLYERLASERPGLERRVVFMTGGAFTARARNFLERVPNARVDKPFSPAMVNDLLTNMMLAG